MIDKREILEAASSLSLLPNVVEKDYVLGWILSPVSTPMKRSRKAGSSREAPVSRSVTSRHIVFRRIWISRSPMKVALKRNSCGPCSKKSLLG
jgi:hypothetical protein